MADGSLGYASRLSHREDLGKGLGAREYLDTAAEVALKAAQLASLIAGAKRLVVFTGAGISTSCGIPDFRGPKGVWTLQRRGQPPPTANVRFDRAAPSLTHMVLVGLQRTGRLALVVSQNVDCLHIRSGLARGALAELHGNCFIEMCDACATEYVRDFEVPSVGLSPTGRACERCAAPLRDQCLDWESELPEAEMARAEEETERADLVLCLGTSLQITPACHMPTRATRNGGKLAIVNMQRTPKDGKATLCVRARVDAVMARVARALALEVPPYVRTDRVLVQQTLLDGGRRVRVQLRSVHGEDAPLHWLESCELATAHATSGGARAAVRGARTSGTTTEAPAARCTEASGWCVELPCTTTGGQAASLELRFAFSDLCTARSCARTLALSRGALPVAAAVELEFETVRTLHDLDAVIAAADAEIATAAADGARSGPDADAPKLLPPRRAMKRQPTSLSSGGDEREGARPRSAPHPDATRHSGRATARQRRA